MTMAGKDSFSTRDWEFITRLPYRIGVWMSHQDLGGGDEAVEGEQDALMTVITRIQAKYSDIAFMRALAAEMELHALETKLDSEKSWQIVLADIPRALELIRNVTDVLELNCYKLILIEIAEAVAKGAADREHGAYNLYGGAEKGWFGLYPLIARITRLGRGPRVSVQEKQAINTLIHVLDAQDLVQDWELNPFHQSTTAH